MIRPRYLLALAVVAAAAAAVTVTVAGGNAQSAGPDTRAREWTAAVYACDAGRRYDLEMSPDRTWSRATFVQWYADRPEACHPSPVPPQLQVVRVDAQQAPGVAIVDLSAPGAAAAFPPARLTLVLLEDGWHVDVSRSDQVRGP